MAKDVHANPWVFDTQDTGEGLGPDLDAVATVFKIPIYINRIKIYTGAGGAIRLESRKNAGAGNRAKIDVIRLQNTAAQETIEVALGHYFDGIYLTTLPTDALVYVYHGEV